MKLSVIKFVEGKFLYKRNHFEACGPPIVLEFRLDYPEWKKEDR